VLKISSSQENKKSTIRLCGRLTKEYLPEVSRLLDEQAATSETSALDLTNVTFVDREAMVFLCSAKSKNIGIENCPSYVVRWIKQEGLCTNPAGEKI
jgi:ABC-type transporter Mla MlaB component